MRASVRKGQHCKKPAFWIILAAVVLCVAVTVCLLWAKGCFNTRDDAVTGTVYPADPNLEWESTKLCLNPELFGSDVPRTEEGHCPVFKAETKEEFEALCAAFQTVLEQHAAEYGISMEETMTVSEQLARYDEAFFAERSVVIAYVSASSGSYRYGLRNVTFDGPRLCLNVRWLNPPGPRDLVTCDMAAWFVIAEIPDEMIQPCTSFDARIVK